MSDNLFDRLFELLQSPGPVNWKLAHEVVASVVEEREVIDPQLVEQYQELALTAELHSAATPGIAITSGVALHPVDRATWAEENEQSFRFLIEPLGERLASLGETGPMASVLQPLGPALLGLQTGILVGSMSSSTLGQFDTGLPALEHDRRYLIVPNVEAFAASHGLDAQQVRLWAATREIVHSSVLKTTWLQRLLVDLVSEYFADLELDQGKLTEQLAHLQDPDQLKDLMGTGSELPALLGGKVDAAKHDRIEGLLVFIEGFGSWATRRALLDLVLHIDTIERAATDRDGTTQVGEALHQLTSIRVNRTLIADVVAFVTEVERRWGEDAVEALWSHPDHPPFLNELNDPVGWAARVLLGQF